MSLTTKLVVMVSALLLGSVAHAQEPAAPIAPSLPASKEAPYTYREIHDVIEALCNGARYGYRAEIEDLCPKIFKRLQPQVDAEKKAAVPLVPEKKEDKQ